MLPKEKFHIDNSREQGFETRCHNCNKITQRKYMEESDSPPIGEQYIYIISNPAWPKYFKVGKAKRLKNRLRQYLSSDPFRAHKYEWYKSCSNWKEVENKFKLDYKQKRKHEWVEDDLEFLKIYLQTLIDNL